MISKLRNILFKGWLVEAVFLSLLTLMLTLTVTFVSDSVYKNSVGKKVFIKGNLALVDQNGNASASTGQVVNSTNNVTSNTNQNSNQTNNPPVSSPPTSVTNPPSSNPSSNTPPSPPPASNNPPTSNPPSVPPPPPPAPSGCFVTVNGYLYNMQPAVGKTLTDPNTGKTRTHTSSTFQCGSFSSPTNMTNIYLSKHSGLGCASRLAPYIYTPPAPKDPTC